MEPLTALGLAAAVVQFADFGVRLLSGTVRVYHSTTGQKSEHVVLATISWDLNELAKSIEIKSKSLIQHTKPLTPTEETLLRISKQCQDTTARLNNLLQRLQANRKCSGRFDLVKESFFVTARTYCSSRHIHGLHASLVDIRQQMMMASLAVLWEQTLCDSGRLNRMSQQQTGIIDALNQIRQTTCQLTPNVVKVSPIKASDKVSNSEASAFAKKLWNTNWTPTGPIDIVTETVARAVASSKEEDIHPEKPNLDMFCTLSIINSLEFEGISFRGDAIPEAYETTFEWAFKKPSPDSVQWSDFGQWVRQQQPPVYWITGKAGAGKSTLMKYLFEHEITKQHLENWSKPLPLVLAGFYFWNVGSDMQKSQEGFLRTILHQVLRQMPHITPKVCPRRWAFLKLFGTQALKPYPEWTVDELLESMSILTELFVDKEFKISLFIDGLDEFDGDHTSLIALVKRFHSCEGAKVCVSSRPWHIFADAFHENPSLRVQDLTRGDMEIYVKGHFEANRAFLELQRSSPQEAASLISHVVDKSEGIFLWVAVVVKTLLEALTDGNGPTLDDLQQTLDQLPQDISELYQRIWTQIDPKYVGDFSQMFQILDACEGPLDDLTLWLAERQGPLSFNKDDMSTDQRLHVTQVMRRRLSSRTKGLLEISSERNVDYLHRSVRDWVQPMWQEVCAKAPPEFDPNAALLIATIAQMDSIQAPAGRGATEEATFPRDLAKRCLNYASRMRDTDANFKPLVACLDRLDAVLRSRHPYYFRRMAGCDISREPQVDIDPCQPWVVQGKAIHHYPESPMACLAAQHAIAPYVRAKVLEKPGILQLQYSDTISILGCAVFGPEYLGKRPGIWKGRNAIQSVAPVAQRYEMVKFLLQHSALGAPEIYKHKAPHRNNGCFGSDGDVQHYPRGGHYGWAVFKKVQRENRRGGHVGRQQGPPCKFTAKDGKEFESYWEATMELFERCSEFRLWKEWRGRWCRFLNCLAEDSGYVETYPSTQYDEGPLC
ncbi:hypothetical protein QBC44DRAFT_403817 [Cladorrhinum sp. PSN332]|nr:hypothetical protein QBC44DRAFT_403817 [Cladorrhinum sp. PSN332]